MNTDDAIETYKVIHRDPNSYELTRRSLGLLLQWSIGTPTTWILCSPESEFIFWDFVNEEMDRQKWCDVCGEPGQFKRYLSRQPSTQTPTRDNGVYCEKHKK